MRVPLKWFILGSILLVAAFLLGRQSPAETELAFLAVGQGDCTVFRTEGKTLLIDVGPVNGRSDAGERIINPFLRRSGVKKIDLILLSHPDNDHIGGLTAIANRFPIGMVAIPGSFRKHPDMIAKLKDARIRPEQVDWLEGPAAVRFGSFQVYTDAVPWAEGYPDNDGSMFVHLSNGVASATFSGDASESVEMLMSGKADWSAQVLHAGHHGSSSSTSYAWIRAVKPQVAVISCGRENRYSHPAPDVLKRLTDLGVEARRTDRDGTLRFRVGELGFQSVR